MAEKNKKEATYRQKAGVAFQVVEILKGMGNREMIDVLELATKLSFPGCHVKLVIEGF